MTTAVANPVLVDHFVSRSQLSNLALVASGAAMVGLSAQITIPLWPVPITAQTLAVMLVGATLGANRAAASLATYLLLGCLGMPWFAGFSGGPATVMSPSFGFIVGFIPAAYLTGWLASRCWDRTAWRSLATFGLASVVPFLFGIPYLWFVLHLGGVNLSLSETLQAGLWPFIPGGIVKWFLGAMILTGTWKILGRRDSVL